jgi:hypothetical protein
MQLGDPSAAERAERDRLDVILDQLASTSSLMW